MDERSCATVPRLCMAVFYKELTLRLATYITTLITRHIFLTKICCFHQVIRDINDDMKLTLITI
jgi:hypothetical protein